MNDCRDLSSVFVDCPNTSLTVLSDVSRKPVEELSAFLSLAESLLDCEVLHQYHPRQSKQAEKTMRSVELDVSIPQTNAEYEDLSCGASCDVAGEDLMCDLGDLLIGGSSFAVGSKKGAKHTDKSAKADAGADPKLQAEQTPQKNCDGFQDKEPPSAVLSLAESLLDCEVLHQYHQRPSKQAKMMRSADLDVSIPQTDVHDGVFSSCGGPCDVPGEDFMCDLDDLLTGGSSFAAGSEPAAAAKKDVLIKLPSAAQPTYLQMLAPSAAQGADPKLGVAPARHVAELALRALKRREQNREAQRRHRIKAKQARGFW